MGLSHNVWPLQINISVKFHSDIPYSKGTTGQKPFLRSIKGRQPTNWKGQSNSPLSQYVNFDGKHICDFSYNNGTTALKPIFRPIKDG